MIFDKIIDWADERLLFEQPHNENALIRMIVEEVKEYLDGKLEDDIMEEIDALGDIPVFLIGELPRLGVYPDKVFGYEKGSDITIKELIDKHYFNSKMSTGENIVYRIASIIGATNDYKIRVIRELSLGCFQTMIEKGFDPDKVMEEIYKEINSRTGAFDPKQGKWMKFKTPEAMAKWYKADFTKCKLEEPTLTR